MSYLAKDQSREDRRARAEQALVDYKSAAIYAKDNGLELIKKSKHHYQLTNGKWLINLYPSNTRIYHDTKRPGPFLKAGRPWTLIEVITAAIRAEKEGNHDSGSTKPNSKTR